MRKILILMVMLLTLVGCQNAPKNITYGWDVAMDQADLSHSFYVNRIKAYNSNLGLEQENHRNTIFKDQIKLLKKNGQIDADGVMKLFKLLKDKEKTNRDSLKKHAKLDAKVEESWKHFEKIMGAVRRYLASGMTEEDRQELYKTLAQLAKEGFKTIEEEKEGN